MAPRRDYAGQTCSLSRALEIVGERWSLLIVRDAFLGVRRFGDFAAHLRLPRAVLSDRLKSLTEAGVLASADDGTPGYVLTEKGMTPRPTSHRPRRNSDNTTRAPGPGARSGQGESMARFDVSIHGKVVTDNGPVGAAASRRAHGRGLRPEEADAMSEAQCGRVALASGQEIVPVAVMSMRSVG